MRKTKIKELFAFVSNDQSFGEGIVAEWTEHGWMPLIGADMERVESIRPTAQIIAKNTKRPITLAKFTIREDVEVIKP